jgi:hypothetical protein
VAENAPAGPLEEGSRKPGSGPDYLDNGAPRCGCASSSHDTDCPLGRAERVAAAAATAAEPLGEHQLIAALTALAAAGLLQDLHDAADRLQDLHDVACHPIEDVLFGLLDGLYCLGLLPGGGGTDG